MDGWKRNQGDLGRGWRKKPVVKKEGSVNLWSSELHNPVNWTGQPCGFKGA